MDLKKHTLPSLLEIDRHSSKPTTKATNTKLQTITALSTPVTPATAKPEKINTTRKAPVAQPERGTLETVYEENIYQAPSTVRGGSPDSKLNMSRYSPEKKILKKLYTDTMYKQFSDKLDNLRRKYDYVYKNVVKDSELDVEKEKIKDIVLKSENLFNTTYSIKYFGMKDNQIGILSKRVALGQKPASRQEGTIQSWRSDNGKMRGKERAATSGDRGDFGSDLVSKSYRRHGEGKGNEDFVGYERSKERINKTAEMRMATNFDEIKHSLNNLGSEHAETEGIGENIRTGKEVKHKEKHQQFVMKNNLITKIENSSARANYQETLIKQPGGSALNSLQATSDHETQDEREAYEPHATIKNTAANYKMSSQVQTRETHRTEHGGHVEWEASTKSPNGYMVTQYFIPRRLQGQKKASERKEAKKLTGLEKNARDQAEINTLNFERTLKSLPKVKRSMLRNVTSQTNDDYTDELDVLEDYRTHEMKGITANIAKFSYSTLLKSINTTENLEDTFVEKNKILEKVIKKREQMKQKVKIGNAATRSLYNEQSSGFEQLLKRGNTVNVKVENSEDEMYKTYVKLKKKL